MGEVLTLKFEVKIRFMKRMGAEQISRSSLIVILNELPENVSKTELNYLVKQDTEQQINSSENFHL